MWSSIRTESSYKKYSLSFPSITVMEIRILTRSMSMSISDFLGNVIEQYGFSFEKLPRQTRMPKNYKTRITPYLRTDLIERVEARYGPKSVPKIAINAYIRYKADHLEEIESALTMHTVSDVELGQRWFPIIGDMNRGKED